MEHLNHAIVMVDASPDTSRAGFIRRLGFTLVEMLVVMAVIVVLISIATPAFNAINGANTVTRAISGIASIMEQGRAYAMANNTYVYVGLTEISSSQPASADASSAYGRVIVAVAATKDGTSHYDVTALDDWKNKYLTNIAPNLVSIGKAQAFDNVHLIDLGPAPSTPPPDATVNYRPDVATRPSIPDDSNSSQFRISRSDAVAATVFAYPMGQALGNSYQSTNSTYTFSKVVCFDPQGVARYVNTTNKGSVPMLLEIGMQQSRGPVLPPIPPDMKSGNMAAIQIDGISGAVQIYRP